VAAVARLEKADIMGEYRAYLLKADGHIWQRIDLVCENDAVAKEQAKQLIDGHDVELWQFDRRIETFKHRK
jgi:hypothetical protein